ncbi:MAG: nicotinate-nucleotide adenylyltransferase [Tyzzerella sp.]|nr:nicotinate-nucleotide adenylyltransferase [Tyzzerella sp.]
MKIGIMGGTFDPIHKGHLMLGEYARELFALDEIWFMPNGNPPHKLNENIESQTNHRVEMVKRAIEGNAGFVLQLYEVNRKEVNYSYKTMEHFKEVYPDNKFYFIIGADSLFALERWVHPERLLKTCIILAAYRDGKDTKEMEAQIQYLNEKFDADIRLLNTPNVDISSSEIRRRMKSGESIEDLVPESVYSYIQSEQLFKDDENESV